MKRTDTTNLRQLHYKFAPFMIFPLVLTVITGTLFQVAFATGKADDFIWLLELHRGKFGRINLEMIYPFLNGFGLLMLGVTGILMWLNTKKDG
ncbi:PepSY domain-containing protein [Crocosphaera sp. Alani8]|uniref:PepSY domain-containing protein n=1 Tax=Crocosphaera sp. Alani8 TaxID=3038952 RepID=UPI00313CA8AC